MSSDLNLLASNLNTVFSGRIVSLVNSLDELTMVVQARDMLHVLRCLRDDPAFRFEQLMDLCGVDYSTY